MTPTPKSSCCKSKMTLCRDYPNSVDCGKCGGHNPEVIKSTDIECGCHCHKKCSIGNCNSMSDHMDTECIHCQPETSKSEAEIFFNRYAERSNITPNELKRLGCKAVKCDCNEEGSGCEGWRMECKDHGTISNPQINVSPPQPEAKECELPKSAITLGKETYNWEPTIKIGEEKPKETEGFDEYEAEWEKKIDKVIGDCFHDTQNQVIDLKNKRATIEEIEVRRHAAWKYHFDRIKEVIVTEKATSHQEGVEAERKRVLKILGEFEGFKATKKHDAIVDVMASIVVSTVATIKDKINNPTHND